GSCTLSLHDALPIFVAEAAHFWHGFFDAFDPTGRKVFLYATDTVVIGVKTAAGCAFDEIENVFTVTKCIKHRSYCTQLDAQVAEDRKSTRLNSSHVK